MNRIGIRVIVSSRFTKGFFDRLHKVFGQYGMRITEKSCVPYWKIDGMDEIGIEADHAPTLPYGKWTEIFEALFCHKDYHIERDDTSDAHSMVICRYTKPEDNEKLDEENYFVIMGIPAPCFTGEVPYRDCYGRPLTKQ